MGDTCIGGTHRLEDDVVDIDPPMIHKRIQEKDLKDGEKGRCDLLVGLHF